eukprot:CAMPEP_0113628820 /NCGR_PEP_ID=MMETSP0017_2-20120614/14942_1 /TAXON_ID=2856 /ORGANISM="Cylindrotheca closterium" /LENGTH=273 /DNA_ID=CAMNT_0000539157 /DNA_START=98 /DNA_END=919 /DNA_ORIENTATION=- /assembly_acc=CAM_ASM_000147
MAYFLLLTASFIVSRTSALLVPTNPTSATVCLQMADATSVNTADNRDIIQDSELDDFVEESTLDVNSLDTLEVKKRLLEVLPRMTGSSTEFREVETLVNTLEDRHKPVLTLDFLNLAMAGEWQLLFSTSLSSRPRQNFRITEMFQRVESVSMNSQNGTVANEVSWELAENGISFDASGLFTVVCDYEIKRGSRLELNLQDSILKLAKGSALPEDIESLIGLMNRAMPKELFDPSDHAVDTTYLDGDLRITRMTGPRFEGVRDIFIRRGSMEID